jgi:hypothetical protein
MAWIEKKLHPSLKIINSFRRMKKVGVHGISFMENRQVGFSKNKNKFIMNFDIQIAEYKNVESAKISNLQNFTFLYNNQSYVIPDGMSRITKFKDNFVSSNSGTFSLEVEVDAIFNNKIDVERQYYFRYFVPVEKRVSFDDYEHYGFLCNNKQTGGLIKIACSENEIHLYHFGYQGDFYLVVESTRQCYLKEIEDIAYATLLTYGFFSGTLHLQETYIVASKSKSFSSPVGLYYKSLREAIFSQYSIFTTNAYSVLIPIARKMKAENAEERMMKILEEKWKFRIERVREDVFSRMMNLFYEHESISRAALTTLTASKLGLELQAGVYCIAFETICNSINKIYNLQVQHIINETQWRTILPDLLEIFNQSSLPKEAINFGKNKINNLNQPTNKDKLTLSSKAVEYNLSKEEIKAINDRNLFLHGHLNVKPEEKEIDKLFYTSIMFHRLCCTLILKMSGFNGHIVNNIALYAPDINSKANEWGFKKI